MRWCKSQQLTSQPDILLMAQVPPNNTQQCSAAHFGRQSSILSWSRVWHGQHARFCFFPLLIMKRRLAAEKSHPTLQGWYHYNMVWQQPRYKEHQKKSVGQCWVTVHCSLGAAPAFVVALPDAEQLTSPGSFVVAQRRKKKMIKVIGLYNGIIIPIILVENQ